MPIPTRRLALLAAAASVAAAFLAGRSVWALVIVNAVVLLIALGDWALAPKPDSVDVERKHPNVIVLGSNGELSWTVTNPTARRLVVDVADELAPSLRASTRRIHVALRGGETRTEVTELRPTRRGRFVPSDLTVRVAGPLGLAARQRTRQSPSTLRVYPKFTSRQDAELRIRKGRILEVGLRSAQGRGGGTDFDQLREYGVDDEFRRIDWAATARASKTIVRTYRAERNQTVIALLDNGRVMAGKVADAPRVEHAMDALMMLTTVATRLGDRVGMLAFDQQVRAIVPPSRNAGQLTLVTEAMHDLEPSLAESDYRGAFTEALVRFKRRAMIVVFTELVEQAVGEFLIPALPLISRNHVVVIAAATDPEVARWARSVPVDAEAAYRKAAAVAALDERARTSARLRGLGANVVDGPPGRLAAGVADAYLSVKATGRL